MICTSDFAQAHSEYRPTPVGRDLARHKDWIYKTTNEVAEIIARGRKSGLAMIAQEKYLSVLRYMSWNAKMATTREKEAQQAINKTEQRMKDLERQSA